MQSDVQDRPASGEDSDAAGPQATRTRLDLAIAVQRQTPVSRRQSVKLVQMVIEELVEALARGESVKLSGFGAFQLRSKAERIGRNPKNGEPATISPRRVVVFRASRLLRTRIATAETQGD